MPEEGGGGRVIYLDHNATTPLDPRVFEAMLPLLRVHWGNPSSPYRFGKEAGSALEYARQSIAGCIGCTSAEIVFTGSGTEADNLAIRGVAHTLKNRGNHIVTTSIEHPAVLHTCRALEAEGYEVTCLPVDPDGVVDLPALERSLTTRTILVSVMHANNETGVLQPVEEIGAVTRKRGIVLHVDAVQTAGKTSEPLAALGADLVSLSGHKLYGPKGTGVLYVRRGTPLTPVLTGGGQERGLRAGTENVPGIVGMSVALSLACEGAEVEGKRLGELRDRFERQICETLPRVEVNGRWARRMPGTTNLTFHGVDGESIVLALDLLGICVSTGSACSTADPEPSHVLLAMGRTPR